MTYGETYESPKPRTRTEEIEYQRYCVAECLATLRHEPTNQTFAKLLVWHRQQLTAMGSPDLSVAR
jgi:hypothetical protein